MTTYISLNDSLPFKKYIDACKKHIHEKRSDYHHSILQLDANAPFEYYPSHQQLPYECGALLIHGLFDSPFTMRDIGEQLQQQHIPSKAVLLPGHGTNPEDLLRVSYHDWINTVTYGIETLRKEVSKIFLVGFSTGAILSLYHAFKNADIAGVILLAPAIQVKGVANMVINWHHLFSKFTNQRDWIYHEPEIDYAKYRSYGFHPVTELHQLAYEVTKLAESKQLSCPIFMALSDRDETISAHHAIQFFKQQNHLDSRLWLYTGNNKNEEDIRIIQKPTAYPEMNIDSISHIALPFSPNNLHYGNEGDFAHASKFCKQTIDGAYNHIQVRWQNCGFNLGLCRKRKRTLTYNPNFADMVKEMIAFIDSNKRIANY